MVYPKGFCAFSVVLLGLFLDKGHAATGPSHGKIVVCYLGTWAVYRPERGQFSIDHVDPTLCTHLVYSFAGLDVKEDAIRSLDPWQDLTENYGKGGFQRMTSLKGRYPHLKITLALGGWNEGSANYSALVADPDRRRRFVASASSFIKQHNFDGLDLDWEFPGKRGGSKEHDKLNFLLLVKELRAAFQKQNLLLTAAFGASQETIDVAYDVEGLSAYLDYIHMMCYDYHGAWDERTGPNSPLFSDDRLSVKDSVEYMLEKGANPGKLILGIPLYGRTFLLQEPAEPSRKPKLGAADRNVGFQGPYTRENGFMGYNEICVELKNDTAGWKQFWDSDSKTPFAVWDHKVISYDDPRSIREKVKFAMEHDLGGVMVWSIDTDDFHGDCAEASETGHFENFPLMRSINAAIESSLTDLASRPDDEEEDIADDENSIIHGNLKHTRVDHSGGRRSQLSLGVLVVAAVMFLYL